MRVRTKAFSAQSLQTAQEPFYSFPRRVCRIRLSAFCEHGYREYSKSENYELKCKDDESCIRLGNVCKKEFLENADEVVGKVYQKNAQIGVCLHVNVSEHKACHSRIEYLRYVLMHKSEEDRTCCYRKALAANVYPAWKFTPRLGK